MRPHAPRWGENATEYLVAQNRELFVEIHLQHQGIVAPVAYRAIAAALVWVMVFFSESGVMESSWEE